MAFGEALSIARERNVDFILLGGDLFHENTPSAAIEHKCIKIIRKHMNAQVQRGTSFQRTAGSFSHFHALNHANFEDPNLTVPYPILTIHGNHDDPTGPNAQSVCEKLATCGLLNYFGAVRTTKDIVIDPIILEKGDIKIALYGIGFIPDHKLKNAFDSGEITFSDPPEDSFNVLVVHQNRVPFENSSHKYIPDDMFPTFFHLIIRGHEHNTQLPEAIPDSEVGGMVYQPGSTVATSISLMEAKPKQIGLIKLTIADPQGDSKSRFKMGFEPIELTCCRRMIIKDISQKEIFKNVKKEAGTGKITSEDFKRLSREYLEKSIETLLSKYERERAQWLKDSQSSDSNLSDKLSRFDLPLMRIRLEYTSRNERFDELDVVHNLYPSRVANKDIILFKKQKLSKTVDGKVDNITFLDDHSQPDDGDDDIEHINLGEQKRDTIDSMIERYFLDKPAEMRLQALSLVDYINAVKGTGEDGNVIAKVLHKRKDEIIKKYRKAINNEEVAESKFNDEEKIEKWFLNAFDNNDQKIDDDEDMVIVIE